MGGRSGGLGRWRFSELGEGFGGDSVVCGTGNLEVDGDGFCVWRFGCVGVDSGRRLGVEGVEVDAGCWVRIGEGFGRVWRSEEV